MKKNIILRSLMGAPLGLTISVLITVGSSLCIADGAYYPVVPEFAAACGSELTAVVLQTVLCLFYGAVWGAASLVWEVDHWSLLRQTVTHLVLCSLSTFFVAYTAYWMGHTIASIAVYFGIFLPFTS
ncbi:hypothetical protein SDC9_106283 [bioreactor metagenome]|uniref:DUF3021 domain-containing protein n=1 Tax=bioreactor metagenome TaxID=1076179 RepID=A0A645B4D8_9ZZZZ